MRAWWLIPCIALLLAVAPAAWAERRATTADGREVLLHTDGTWEWAGENGRGGAFEPRDLQLRAEEGRVFLVGRLHNGTGKSCQIASFTLEYLGADGGLVNTGRLQLLNVGAGATKPLRERVFQLTPGDVGRVKRILFSLDACL